MLRRASLQTRLLAVTLPLTVGVVAAISLATYLVAHSVVLGQLERDVVRTNAIAVTEARAALEQRRSDLATISESPLFRDHSANSEYGLTQEAEVYRREIEKMLVAFAGRMGVYPSLAYADAAGRVQARVEGGRVAPRGHSLDAALLAQLRGLDKGHFYVSEPAKRPGRAHSSVVFAAALRDGAAVPRGYLVFEYSLERLFGLLSRLAIGESGSSAIVKRVRVTGSGGRTMRDLGNRVVARADIPGTRWAIVTSVKRDEFLDPLRQIGTWTLLLGLLACVLIALAIAQQVSSAVRPIGVLAAASAAYAAGDLKTRVAEDGPSEVGVLASAFNAMAERLQGRTDDLVMRVRELSSLHKLNETALRNLGRLAVARACLEATVEGLGARRGALYRLDEQSGDLVLEASEDPERSEALGRRLSLAQFPLAAKALIEGEAGLIGKESALLSRAREQIVCAPVLTRGRAGHLLCLELPAQVSERMRSLSLFCGAAGMALENADLLEGIVASEQRYRTAIENSPHAVIGLDQHYRVVLWNRRAEALFGWQPSEAYGRTLDFALFGPDYQAIRRIVETTGATRDVQAAAVARDGRRLFVTVSWTGQASAERGVREWFVVIQDETEKRRLQGQLIHAEKLSAVGSLVAGVAHELNNPLAAVVGFAEILKDLPGNARQREDLKHLYGNALRCRDIVRGLLSFVRRSAPRRSRADLNVMLEKVLELIEFRLVRTDGVALDVERSPEPLLIAADPSRIEQVFVNLLSNASDALRAWPRERRVRVRTRRGPGGPVLEIEDTGPGIAPEHRERIFEPFFTTKPLGVGTGLGLAISSQIVLECGGRIACEEATGGGARFVVSFPPCPADVAVEKIEDFVSARAPVNVLLVDDEAPMLVFMERLLAAEGDRVTVVREFDQAQALLEKGGFDLLVVDVDLGPRKGWELVEALPCGGPAVLVVTGDILNNEMAERFSRLDIPVVAKPFLRSEFLRAVRTALSYRTGAK